MKYYLYYFIMLVQLSALVVVGLCLFSGLTKGDYGKIELAQFLLGGFVFYAGQILKAKFYS